MVTQTKIAEQTINCGRSDALKLSMNKRVVLAIDTTGGTGLVTLTAGKKTFSKSWPARGNVEKLNSIIEAVLTSAKVPLPSITEVRVNPGPGSSIGSRAGVTVANTLSWVLGIPVNGKQPPLAVKY